MGKLVVPSPDIRQITRFNISIDQVEEINPLFSKCFIKVLYTGLNRNKVLIEKEVAEEMAKTLYNIPIVGEYVEKIEDFKDHGGKIEIEDDEIEFIHTTKPYGVIPFNTDIKWMQITEKDGTVNDYLTCWGYLWTGRYPEVKRVIEEGNPQSMELDEETLEGQWIKEGPTVYFKITKAVFSALAILGEKVPPAFESASISAYMLNETEFNKKFSRMMKELKESIPEHDGKKVVNFSQKDDSLESNEGGKIMGDELKNSKVILAFELSHDDIRSKLYEKIQPKDDEGYMEWRYSIHDVYDDRAIVYDHQENKHYRQYYTKGENDIALGEKVEVVIKDLTIQEEQQLNQVKEDLNTAQANYTKLEEETNELKENKELYESTKEELEGLRNFKQSIEKEEKEKVITKFASILADEDLAECKEKINEFSKDDIEAKLSVIAVRKNVSFSKATDDGGEEPDLVPEPNNNDDTPGWVKIVREHKKDDA